MTLLERLNSADVVCNCCGDKYGKYSAGISFTRVDICGVCGEKKNVTEVRDYGYLTKGIMEEMEKDQTQDEITLMLTKDEIGFLSQLLYVLADGNMDMKEVALFESIEQKITTLHEDHCITYGLSPAMEAYHEKYKTWGSGSLEEEKRWEGFRDAFVMLSEG